MEITGELFVDGAMFRRMARAEFRRLRWVSALSLTAFVLALALLLDASPMGWALVFLVLLIVSSTPMTPVQRLTRLYLFAGPIVWRYQVDEHGFRVTGRRTVAGSWASYRK